MKQNRFAKTIGVAALLLGVGWGVGWSQAGAAYAVGFTPPADNAAPNGATTGGASRGSFFTPPADGAAPQGTTTGGASRGGFFAPPADSAAPQGGTTGGASRGSFFTPPTDSAAPQGGTTGGASRGSFFTPPADGAAPQGGTTGGASRGDSFVPPADNAAPQGTTGGAARGNTYGTTQQSAIEIISTGSMLAVMPQSFYGTTLEARPTLFVYVPASNATEAVFSLKDEAKDLVYQMKLAVPQSGGMVAIEMPADAPELVVEQNYQWYVALMLDNELSPASPFVDGWVKRIAPTPELASRLGEEGTLANIEALGENGVWYDTIAQLAMLQEAQADETIAGHWFELLESVGLETLAAAPLVM